MGVVEVVVLGAVAWAALRGRARWAVLGALLVALWFPVIPETLDSGLRAAIDVAQTALGRL